MAQLRASPARNSNTFAEGNIQTEFVGDKKDTQTKRYLPARKKESAKHKEREKDKVGTIDKETKINTQRKRERGT